MINCSSSNVYFNTPSKQVTSQPTVTDLLQMPVRPAQGEVVIVSGTSKFNDGAGLIYVWDTNSLLLDDGYLVLKSTQFAVGRWIKTSAGVGSGGAGTPGPKGDTGPQGPAGIQGPIGPAGPKGDTGLQGIQGNTGIQGVKGDTGLTGTKGDTGIQGIQGVKGDTGIQGIQGVKGDTGLQGVKGDTGLTGVKGDTGTAGTNGTNGTNGTSATITVGTVSTSAPGSNATIVNSGTNSAAVFDFTIPRGNTGAAGSGSAATAYHPGYVTGNWYTPSRSTIVAAAMPTGLLRTYPLYIAQDISINALGTRVTTAATGGTALIGVYSNVAGRPANLVVSGEISTASVATVTVAVPATTLVAGWYWFAFSASAAFNAIGLGSDAINNQFIGAGDAITALTGQMGIYTVSASYGMPSTFPTNLSAASVSMPLSVYKVT